MIKTNKAFQTNTLLDFKHDVSNTNTLRDFKYDVSILVTIVSYPNFFGFTQPVAMIFPFIFLYILLFLVFEIVVFTNLEKIHNAVIHVIHFKIRIE